MKVFAGDLTPDELERLREISARLRSIELNPRHWSRAEIEAAVADDMRLEREIRFRLDVEHCVTLHWDMTWGVVYSCDDD